MGFAKTAYCRVFQSIMKVGNYFLPFRTPETLSGAGCVERLPEEMKKRNVRRPLLVTDGGLMKLGLPQGLLRAMEKAGMPCTLFCDIQPNPTDENVEAGFRVFRESGCDAIVAMGGGSPMDCAKAIAARNAHPGRSVAQLQGVLTVHKRVVPLWAVPTTAGTGSETTVAAVITVAETRHKASINDPVLMPRYAVLDPELTVGLPPHITAATGLDALCHAVESYLNHTYCTGLELDYARRAVRLVHDNLYLVYRDGSDLEARQNMQLAAFYAGRSFTRGCVGYIHAVGHTLSGLYGLPHGLAMSVLMPHVLRQYGSAAEKRLGELAEVCGIMGGSDREKADRFIAWIEGMKEKMGIPEGLDCIRPEDVSRIVRWADREANPLYPVPQVWGETELRTLLDTVVRAGGKLLPRSQTA